MFEIFLLPVALSVQLVLVLPTLARVCVDIIMMSFCAVVCAALPRVLQPHPTAPARGYREYVSAAAE